ncbi:hypothetical protein [Neisseria shayeganii]|uniref:hypothetical protein n=1 Tax=Neisseria shayeganii TaxID=607712 RepID=UPI0012EA99E1|nr:hypothetical protein [Neisseria shayeganii]
MLNSRYQAGAAPWDICRVAQSASEQSLRPSAPNHVGNEQTPRPVPDQVMASTGSRSSGGKSSPVPKPTSVNVKGLDNRETQLVYQSNEKHTAGMRGWNRRAGREPQNSLDLFKESIPVSDSKFRFARDEYGHIHRFSKDNNDQWHWSGSTGDISSPLQLDNQDKASLRRLGWRGKELR